MEIDLNSISRVRDVLDKQIDFALVQNRTAKFVLVGVFAGEEVVVGCLRDGSWGTNKNIKGVIGGFCVTVIDVVHCLSLLGMISNGDEKEFRKWFSHCSREAIKQSDIAKLEELSNKYGFTLVGNK